MSIEPGDFLLLSSSDSLVIAGTFGLAFLASALVFWATRKYLEGYARKTPTKVDDVIVSILKGPAVFLAISYVAIWIVGALVGPGSSNSLLESLTLAYGFVLVLFATWVVGKIFVVTMHRQVQARALKTATKVDDAVASSLTATGRVLIIVVGIGIALGLLFLGIGLFRIASG